MMGDAMKLARELLQAVRELTAELRWQREHGQAQHAPLRGIPIHDREAV